MGILAPVSSNQDCQGWSNRQITSTSYFSQMTADLVEKKNKQTNKLVKTEASMQLVRSDKYVYVYVRLGETMAHFPSTFARYTRSKRLKIQNLLRVHWWLPLVLLYNCDLRVIRASITIVPIVRCSLQLRTELSSY